ncbi:MAG: amino acid permease [Parvularculaceae bacterium]|nr:amino acid permease [Parvularculaceae bacterium]
MSSDTTKPAVETRPAFVSGFIRRKSIEQMQREYEGGELKRSLGPWNLILLGIGCIIGTGIFVLTGRAAAEYAGPGIMVSFIITGTLCALVALCYAELASVLPVSGSAYSYSYASMGEFVAWVMGLLLVLEYGLAASTVAAGWSGYVVSFLHDLGINIPAQLTAAPGTVVGALVDGSFMAATAFPEGVAPIGSTPVVANFNLPALIGISAVTVLLVVGINESATVNNIIVFIKVGVVVAFIAIGMLYVNFDNWTPLIPERVSIGADGIAVPAPSEGGFWGELKDAFVAILTGDNSNRYGIGGVIHAAAIIFFAYIGFEAVSTAGAEAKNPARDMPIGILGSLIICTILYILTAGVLVGIVPYARLDNPAPIALAVNEIGLPWFAMLIKIGAIAGLSSVMLVLCYGQTRIFYSMARDGLLPPFFSTVHKSFKTPWINTLIVGLLAGSGAAFMSLDALSELTNVGTLAAFMIVCMTVLYLRITAPKLPRPFRAPLGPVTPILGAALCLLLLMTLMTNPHTRDFFIKYVVVGLAVYFLYGFWFSKLGKENGRKA